MTVTISKEGRTKRI